MRIGKDRRLARIKALLPKTYEILEDDPEALNIVYSAWLEMYKISGGRLSLAQMQRFDARAARDTYSVMYEHLKQTM